MHKQQQHVADSLRRVQAFLDTHAAVLGPLKDTEARKQLDQAVDRATAHALGQLTAEREFAGAGNQVKRLAGDLKASHMTPVAMFARAKLRGVPDFKALAEVPHNLRGPRLVTAAHAMATAATPYIGRLEKAQFPGESVPQLASAAGALDAAFAERIAAGSRRVVATAGIRKELAVGREAVAMLDPIVTKRLARQEELLAGWRSAKRITLRPQGNLAPATPAASGSSTAPVVIVTPAATGASTAPLAIVTPAAQAPIAIVPPAPSARTPEVRAA